MRVQTATWEGSPQPVALPSAKGHSPYDGFAGPIFNGGTVLFVPERAHSDQSAVSINLGRLPTLKKYWSLAFAALVLKSFVLKDDADFLTNFLIAVCLAGLGCWWIVTRPLLARLGNNLKDRAGSWAVICVAAPPAFKNFMVDLATENRPRPEVIDVDADCPPQPLQSRSRRYGKPVQIYKLRSMKYMEDGPVIRQVYRSVPRDPQVGRFLRRRNAC